MLSAFEGLETSMMKYRSSSYTIALCALLTALGVAVMLASGLIPILTYCSPLIASLFLIPVLREYGKSYSWLTWAATAILSAILCADKEAAFFYIFLGYYPILRPFFSSRGRSLWAAKLLYFAAALFAMYTLILLVLGMDIGVEGKWLMITLYITLLAVMLLYDFALRKISILYERRLREWLFKRSS